MAQNTWALSKGNGLSITEKAETIDNNGDRVVTETVKDAGGAISSVHQYTFHAFPWGESAIQSVEDPSGAALATHTIYDDNPANMGSYGKEKQVIYPDGAWVSYAYDTTGRKIGATRSYLDQSPQALPADVKTVVYDYTAVDPADEEREEDRKTPRTITEYTQGIVTSKTYAACLYDINNGRIDIRENCLTPSSAYGDAGNLRTTRTYYPMGHTPETSSRIQSVVYPDHRQTTYTYETGLWDGTAFVPGDGGHTRESAVHGTVGQPEGIAYKTVKDLSIRDPQGNTVRTETQVYTGNSYDTIKWTTFTYDALGHRTGAQMSDGTLTESVWGCCALESEVDGQGGETQYTYNDLKQIETATRKGQGAQGDMVTAYTYDASGRRLTHTREGGPLSLASQTVYDGAGRISTHTDQAGLITTYTYPDGGRTTQVTHPGGAVEITTRYLDGRVKSVTGTAGVSRYYTYGVNGDGTTWTQVHTGGPSSPMWEKTYTDLLGRTVKIETPGYIGIETTENTYDDQGRLVKTTVTGQADTLYVYDDLGNQIRSGLDVDGNGQLQEAAPDRISDTDTAYVMDNTTYFQETVTRIYPDTTPVVTNTRRTRLTDLGAAGLIAEDIATDISGNQTLSRTYVDRATKTVTRVIDHPDAANDTTQIVINGLLQSLTTKSGHTVTYGYDALGRRTSVHDPRTGDTLTGYDEKGRIGHTEDPLQNRTTFAYDATSGRKVSETNPLNKTVRYAYNARGQITNTWGEATTPVHYIYDDYGRMTEMHTYRTESGFSGETWPQTAGTEDKTIWRYHDATGYLAEKEDAQGNKVMYTYEEGNRLKTRMWARPNGSNPLLTTYTYDPNTGELTGIDYSDATQDIAFTYDRLGRRATVTDAAGTRTFAYDHADLQLLTETMTGLYTKTLPTAFAYAGTD